MKKLITWCKEHFFTASTLFLLAFIPLYPKLPLLDVFQTWVYIRLEDFLVAIILFVYLISRLKQKKFSASELTWPIVIYWAIGLISAIFSLIFIGPYLNNYEPHLTVLHFARRIEYMMVFFVAYDVIARKKSLLTAVLWTLAATVLGIIIYGVAQKFLGWPAFLTMNEEFAKGTPLRLPPTARIPSTFGGHYDLAAYIVLTLPIFATFAFAAKKVWQKIVFFVLAVGSLVLLLFTASRTSFLVYLVAITATLVWYKKKIFIIPVVVLSFALLNYVGVASDRFYKTFRYSDVIVDLSTGKPVGTLEKLEGGSAVVSKPQSPAEESLPEGSQYIGLASSQTGEKAETVEIYKSIDLATASGEIATISGSFLIQKALVYDISITTRLQGQWPKAMEAFRRNIVLGSGYSTLSVAADGDYMRMLGETGIVGTIAFLGILVAAFALFLKKKDTLEPYPKAFVIGVFGGIVGLLCNAILIDVFEASKVAFSLWLLLGVAIALLSSEGSSMKEYGKLMWTTLTSNVMYLIYLFLACIVLFGGSVSHYFVGDDFTWLKWAAQTSYTDIPSLFTDAQGFFYRPIPKLWYMVLYAVFWLKPGGYHIMSLILLGVCSYLLFIIMRKIGVRREIALISGILFASLSIHHENVFWISGASSLLAATSLFGSIYAFLSQAHKRGWIRIALQVTWVTLMVISMLSYDGMIVAPVILSLIGWFVLEKKHWTSLAPLLVIPLYWWVRVLSGAVNPSGDYGYRLSALPVNVVGNAVGYIVATFGGPRVVEYWEVVRAYMRDHMTTAVSLGAVIASVVGIVGYKMRNSLVAHRHALLWFILGLVSLGAYLGLGGMSERYAFVASGFFVIALGIWLSVQWDLGTKMIWKWAVVIGVIGLMIWNITEVNRVGVQWKKAGSVSEATLVTLSKMFFPLKERKTFLFIDTPIRYGRAWVFPTGLTDPLWHIFRLSSWDYTIANIGSPKEAYAYPVIQGYSPEVFLFDNLTLKKIVKEVRPKE
jgi:hypothetical protein